MLNNKIIGLFVLGLALSSPLQSASAMVSPPLETDTTGGSSSELTCYEPKQCKSGYTMSADGKSCTLSVTTYATKAECERNNLINECVSNGNGKYIAGKCISLTDASTGACYLSDDSQDCVNDFFTTGCTTIAASRYVPTGCIAYTQAECEAKYPYDYCEKLSRVNCWGPEGGAKYDIPAVKSCTNGVSSIQTGNYANTYHVCAAKTQADCQTVYPGFNCIKVDEQGIGTVYVPAGCKDGYNFENGYCNKIAVSYSTPTACENANPNSTCANTGTSLGYQPNGCKEGYFASEDDCPGDGEGIRDADDAGCGLCEYINYGACYGLGGAYSDYSEEEAVFYGCTDSLTAYIQNKLKTCYTNCVYPHHDVDGSFGECEYADKKVCEAMNEGSTCAQKDGCYVVQTQYQGCEYSSIEDCESKNSFAICEEISNVHVGGSAVCPEVTGCQQGMGLNAYGDCEPVQAETCETLAAPAGVQYYYTAGSKTCVDLKGKTFAVAITNSYTTASGNTITCAACCEYYSSNDLRADHPNADTIKVSNGVCQSIGTCKSGYTLSADGRSCVADGSSGSGDYGVCEYSTKDACENANPGFKCVDYIVTVATEPA